MGKEFTLEDIVKDSAERFKNLSPKQYAQYCEKFVKFEEIKTPGDLPFYQTLSLFEYTPYRFPGDITKFDDRLFLQVTAAAPNYNHQFYWTMYDEVPQLWIQKRGSKDNFYEAVHQIRPSILFNIFSYSLCLLFNDFTLKEYDGIMAYEVDKIIELKLTLHKHQLKVLEKNKILSRL